jgi:hypothetical protein
VSTSRTLRKVKNASTFGLDAVACSRRIEAVVILTKARERIRHFDRILREATAIHVALKKLELVAVRTGRISNFCGVLDTVDA